MLLQCKIECKWCWPKCLVLLQCKMYLNVYLKMILSFSHPNEAKSSYSCKLHFVKECIHNVGKSIPSYSLCQVQSDYFYQSLCVLAIQVPQDEWGGYPGGGKDDEIPCRRMRSSSYVKAMGDEESGDSDSSPKTSPQKMVRPDALVKAIIRPRDLLDSQRYNTCSLKV